MIGGKKGEKTLVFKREYRKLI